MAISDLFKSSDERKRELRRKQHQLEREARKGIKKLDDSIREHEKQRHDLWEKAKQFLITGQKTEAANLVRQHKLLGVSVNRLIRQKSVMDSKLTQVSTAGSIGEIARLTKEFAQSLNIDPIGLGEDLDEIEEVTDNADDINETIDAAYMRDMEKATAEAERLQTSNIDDEMRALEAEAAASLGGGSIKIPEATDAVKKVTSGDINEGLKDIEERLSKL